jgi:hypothetical protein
MAKKARQGTKAKNGKNAYRKGDLWIAPSFSLKQKPRQSGWELPKREPPESNKFLDLADVAFGLKEPEKLKRKRTA